MRPAFVLALALSASLTTQVLPVHAQNHIRLVVGFPAGSAIDREAREFE